MSKYLSRIVIHWTAGTHKANATDKKSYHYLVEGDGNVVKGVYAPEDNINCKDGKYAQHTGGGNTGSIGVSLCGMAGFCSGKPTSTKYPLTAKQCEAAWKLVAELCSRYSIEVTENTVLTHSEFNKKNPKASKKIKIDIDYLPYQPHLTSCEIGKFIRNKVVWYSQHI